eukprot:8214089-Pyramimonas_sp.AAC.1
MEPYLPPTRSPLTMRCLHATDGNQRCYPTCLFWATNSRRKHPTILENTPSAGQALRLSFKPPQWLKPIVHNGPGLSSLGDWGGWNGPFPVVRNDPGRGQGVTGVGNRDVQVQYGDARHSLYIEPLIAREIGSDYAVLRTVLTVVASLLAGRPGMTFGYVPTKRGMPQMT